MANKFWTVSCTQTIEAETEQEALNKFEKNLKNEIYYSDNFEIEFDTELSEENS